MKGNCDRTLGTPGAWCPAHHVPAVSAELAEAQLSAMEQPQLSVKSCLGDLSCVGIFFFFLLLLFVLPSAASATPLLNSDAPPSDLCSGSA